MRRTDERYRRVSSSATAVEAPRATPGRSSRSAARYAGIQRKAAPPDQGATGQTAPLSGGEPLPADVQEQMEGAFGADFDGVRVHADSEEPAQIGATAYTQGQDIAFAPGAYDPASTAGRELIGHELTHVVQQDAGRAGVQAKDGEINADASLEREADQLGAMAARGQSVNVQGSARGVQLKGKKGDKGDKGGGANAVANSIVRILMDGQRGAAATRAAADAAKAGVDAELKAYVLQEATSAADTAAQSLIRSATDARTGVFFTTQHGTGAFNEATERDGEEATEHLERQGYSEASSKEIGGIAQQAADRGGKEAATVMANRLGTETAQATAQRQLDAVEAQVANQIKDLAGARVDGTRSTVESAVARDAEGLIVPSPELAPAGPEDLSRGARSQIEATLLAKSVEAALADGTLIKAAKKAAKKLKSATGSATRSEVSESMAEQEGAVRQTAIGEAAVAAHAIVDDIEHEADEDETAEAIATISGELAETLSTYVGAKLNATRFHQFGRKRELREQLKSAARQVVNQEIELQMPQGLERQGQEDQLTYKESLAKRKAYGAIKQDVGEFLSQIAQGIAGRAARDQKMAMAACALEAKKSATSPLKALRAAKATLLAHAKTQAAIWVEQLYNDVSTGNVTPVQAAQGASETNADVGQMVRDRNVAEQVIQAADSEEGVGIMGKLLDNVIPDPGDGVAAKITLKIPVLTDPFGGFAAKMNLICEINGKAGRGTEGFVTAGVPAIASNPNHLECELGYSIGLQLEAGDASTLGFDISASYQSFVRAGADSTQSAMAAFRYAVYRGTPIKALAGAWYGGMIQKRGGGPEVDYKLAEQHAAAVEEQHFLAEGKERTFAQHGRGIGVSASAAANVDGATLGKLGAKGEVSGGYSRFRHYDADSLAERRATPQTQEEALARRKAMAKGEGSTGKNTFSASVASEVNLGGVGIALSGAISGNNLKNWGVELKAGIGGSLAGGTSMDAIVTLATALFELEHKLLSAMGSHIDQADEMRAQGMSQQDMRDKLHKKLQKRNLAQGVANEAMVGLSAAGLAESSLAASFQFGLSGGKWTDRFDLISSTKVATPDSIPVFGAEMTKETRLISAEHQGFRGGRRAFRSPGVLVENEET